MLSVIVDGCAATGTCSVENWTSSQRIQFSSLTHNFCYAWKNITWVSLHFPSWSHTFCVSGFSLMSDKNKISVYIGNTLLQWFFHEITMLSGNRPNIFTVVNIIIILVIFGIIDMVKASPEESRYLGKVSFSHCLSAPSQKWSSYVSFLLQNPAFGQKRRPLFSKHTIASLMTINVVMTANH